MARGTTRVRERALVDLDDVSPAEFGQVANNGVTDNAGTNNDNFRRCREVAAHVVFPLIWGRPTRTPSQTVVRE